MQSTGQYFSDIPRCHSIFKSSAFDPIFEHGKAEWAIRNEEVRSGFSRHIDPFDINALAQLLLDKGSATAGAAAETLIPGLSHFLDIGSGCP